jgi:HD-like signal output (HDOD) protein
VPEKRVVAPPPPANAPRTPNFINDVAAGKVELPSIPRVVQQVAAAVQDPDVDARRLGQLLSQDPILAAKVLRLANSSFFGGQRSMSSIDAAVAMIGTQALGRLVLAGGVSSSFGEVPGIDLPTFWRDSLVTATAAQKLASKLGAEAEEAYVSGLLHGTGHLILCKTYPDIANSCSRATRSCAAPSSRRSRRRTSASTIPTSARFWIETIGFPQPVADTIRQAAQPLAPSAGPLDLTLRSACAARRRPWRARTSRPPRGRPAPARAGALQPAATASPTPRSTSSTKRSARPSRSSEPTPTRRRGARRRRLRDALR